MGLAPGLDRRKAIAQRRGQAFGIVALDRQATALLGPIGREGGDYGMAVDLGCGTEHLDISGATALFGEEMEDGAVVPDTKGSRRPPVPDVRDQPIDIL